MANQITTPHQHTVYSGHDIFLIPSKGGTFLLYAPTLKKLLRVTSRLASQIAIEGISDTSDDSGVRKLASLLHRAIPESIQPFPIHLQKSRFFHLALGLTQDCTLNCLYCHADAGRKNDMKSDILVGAVQYAFATSKANNLRGVNVSFAVGGEPTVSWGLFCFCIMEIKGSAEKYRIPTHLSMTTNGYYEARKRQFIAENVDSVLLSLDGPEDIQNLHRPTRAGKESFSVVRESAKFFVAKVNSFAIRSTVSNKSVRRMPEIVEFFHEEFGNQFHLVFEPLVPLGRATSNKLLSEPMQEEFIKFYIEAREVGKKVGIEVRTSASNHNRLVTSFCGAMSIPSFTVTTDGIITTCERDSEGKNYHYGAFSPENKTFDIEDQDIESNKNLLEMPRKCTECFCKWHCAGDCPDVRTIGYDRCHTVRSLIQYELESMLSVSSP